MGNALEGVAKARVRISSDERRQRVVDLVAQGLSVAAITRELGVDKGTIYRDLRVLGLTAADGRSWANAERNKATGAKVAAEIPRGVCDTPGCTDPECVVEYGSCHRCGQPAKLAPQTSRRRAQVGGEPQMHCEACGPAAWRESQRAGWERHRESNLSALQAGWQRHRDENLAALKAGHRRRLEDRKAELEALKQRESVIDTDEYAARRGVARVTVSHAAKRLGLGRLVHGRYLLDEDDVAALDSRRTAGRLPAAGAGEVTLSEAARRLGLTIPFLSRRLDLLPSPRRRIRYGSRTALVWGGEAAKSIVDSARWPGGVRRKWRLIWIPRPGRRRSEMDPEWEGVLSRIRALYEEEHKGASERELVRLAAAEGLRVNGKPVSGRTVRIALGRTV